MIAMADSGAKQEFAIAFGFGLDVSTSSTCLGFLSHRASHNEILSRIAVVAYDIACPDMALMFLDRAKINCHSSRTASQPKLCSKRRNGRLT